MMSETVSPRLRDAVGPKPDPHCVVAAAEQVDLTHARDAGDIVVDVDRRVVRQEVAVVGPVRRLDRDHQEREGESLLDRDAVVLHRLRQLRGGLGDAVLRQDVGHVQVRAHVERHLESHGAVVGVRGLHVDAVLDTVDLLLERRRHRGLDVGRAGADEGGGHLDHRRDDLGVLRDRQARHRHETEQRP